MTKPGQAPPETPTPPQPSQPPQNEKGSDDPPAKQTSEWKLAWLKEITTVVIALAVVGVSGWLLVHHYFVVREFDVTDELVKNPALYAARQSAYQAYLSGQKDVLNYVIGVLGVVMGYFFGRVPAELRAKKAEDVAQTNASAATVATTEAKDAKDKLADTKQTLSAIRSGGTLSAGQQSELDALYRRLG